MTVLIIGASFAGIAAARTLKKLSPETRVILLEKENNLAYMPSGLKLLLSGEISDLAQASWQTQEELETEGVEVWLACQVDRIDTDQQKVYLSGSACQEVCSYDQLICAMGSSPLQTGWELRDPRILTVKSLSDSQEAERVLNQAQQVLVLGAGLVGLELAQALVSQGKEVSLVDSGPSLDFKNLDADMASHLEQTLSQAGVQLYLGQSIQDIVPHKEHLEVQTDGGKLTCQALILATNLSPNTELLEGLVDLAVDGTVKVSDKLESSRQGIYAVGDLVALPAFLDGRASYNPSISIAIRTGKQAAYQILGQDFPLSNSVNPIVSQIFGKFRVSLGLTAQEASLYRDVISLNYQALDLLDQSPLYEIKLVVDRSTGQLLGAQILSDRDLSGLANSLGLALSTGMTDQQLAGQDFTFGLGHSQDYYQLQEAADQLYRLRCQTCS